MSIRDRIEFATKFGAARVFLANGGDVVVARRIWHLVRIGGGGRECRLAMNGDPDLAHSFEFTAEVVGGRGGR